MRQHHTPVLNRLVLLYVAKSILFVTLVSAQSSRPFATRGALELGGNISFQSLAPVVNGDTRDAISVFSLQPFIGYFIAEGFELGLNPLGIAAANSFTQIMIFLAPSYNFGTTSIAYPFVEALVGYTSQANGTSRSGFSWGGRAGVKLAITGNGLLNLGLQYLQITLNRSGDSKRNGSNQLTVSMGFTVWL